MLNNKVARASSSMVNPNDFLSLLFVEVVTEDGSTYRYHTHLSKAGAQKLVNNLYPGARISLNVGLWNLLDTDEDNGRQVGAVLTFKAGVSAEKARRALAALNDILETEGVVVRGFDPTYGGPVWYVP